MNTTTSSFYRIGAQFTNTKMARASYEIQDEWVEAAHERDLSIKEYCRRMIRAGRRQFGEPYDVDESPADPQTLKLDDSTRRSDVDDSLKQWILTNLASDDAQDVDDLVDLLESDLAELADELCEENKAKFRRSEGGYLKLTDTDE